MTTVYVPVQGPMSPLPNFAQNSQKTPIIPSVRTVIPPAPLPSGTANTTVGVPI